MEEASHGDEMTPYWIIHVDKRVVQQNAEHGRFDPAIAVCRMFDGELREFARSHEVMLQGPAIVRQGIEPLPDGTRVWIETNYPITYAEN